MVFIIVLYLQPTYLHTYMGALGLFLIVLYLQLNVTLVSILIVLYLQP